MVSGRIMASSITSTTCRYANRYRTDPLLRGVVLGNVFQDGGEERPQYHLRAVRSLDGLWTSPLLWTVTATTALPPARARPRHVQLFHHIADTPEEDDFGRQAMMDYFKYCVLRAFPDDPETMPPTMHYFMQIARSCAT